jgi:murein L,D-transpeptidase YcbB/YkuD
MTFGTVLPAPIAAAFARALVASALLAGPTPVAGQDPAPEIRERIELLRSTGRLEAGGERIALVRLVPGIYELGGFQPLWADAALAELTRALEGVRADGLDPDAYHLPALRALTAGVRRPADNPAARAELDLLATDALALALRDLGSGRVPAVVRGAAASEPPAQEPDALLAVVRSGVVEAAFAAARPDHWIYRGLVAALARLREVEATGGWGTVPDWPTLLPDSADERVPALRRRLVLGGDLDPEAAVEGELFDPRLEVAVKAFQHRHGLNEDGLVGKATLAELNVPVATRVAQLRTNLERARWVIHDLPRSFLAVNAAGARVYLVRDDAVVFETRAVVGKTYTRTPVFRASMRYIDLNPTWTVPPGIVGEVLAAIRRDPGYLARQQMRVLDASGRTLARSSLDFSRWSARSFPYVFRQDPGPLNPLGQIKFVFPNPYNVYLHDTPARQLFEQEQRTFSHGCIRVQNPLDLAVLVLDDPVSWSREALERAIALGTTRTIDLAEPLPVLVLYWTASADLHGELHFYRDVYGRDPAVLAALDAR